MRTKTKKVLRILQMGNHAARKLAEAVERSAVIAARVSQALAAGREHLDPDTAFDVALATEAVASWTGRVQVLAELLNPAIAEAQAAWRSGRERCPQRQFERLLNEWRTIFDQGQTAIRRIEEHTNGR